MKGSKCRAIVLGEESLLVQCGELLLERDVELQAIVTKNPVIKNWCAQKNIAVLSDYQSLQSEFGPASLDYLFSITNLKVLPDWVISLGKSAINFHDGPLPQYAGLNAPVWAILNQETEHGVTWHEMAAEVDKGRILEQQKFPIVPGETALSLNAKCYQAGQESFARLLDGLLAGQIEPISQAHSQRSYFGLSKRPAAAGLIDWHSGADQIESLVRALDYGNYPSPMVCPKFVWEGRVLLVSHAKIHLRGGDHSPGELLEIASEYLRVACADGVVELSGIRRVNGEKVDCLKQLMNSKGDAQISRLPVFDADFGNKLGEYLESVCRYEEEWVDDLLNAEPVQIPQASRSAAETGNSNNGWRSRELHLPANVLGHPLYRKNSAAFLLSVFSVLLARLNCKNTFTLAVDQRVPDAFAPYFERYLPLAVVVDEMQTFEHFFDATVAALARFRKMAGLASDIRARQPALENHAEIGRFPVKLDLSGSMKLEEIVSDQVSDLYLSVSEESETGVIHYCEERLSEPMIEHLCALLNVIATQVMAQPGNSLASTQIVSRADLDAFGEWNTSEQEYDRTLCVHQLIERQAQLTPAQTALAFEDAEMDYQTLNARANQLARLIAGEGVIPGQLVGVMLDRSMDLIVALVAIHKAGCAYVPLDPVYPAERLKYMVDDSSVSLLLSETRHQQKWQDVQTQVVVLDELDEKLASFSTENPDLALGSDNLAYLIYTSGSTGKPKGVMVEHRNVVNFFAGMDQCIGTTPGVWLAVTSISFDISVLEIFWTLARGFKVVIYSEQSALAQHDEAAGSFEAAGIDFSLFYWNVADEESHHQADKYRLLLDGAKFADTHGFKAVWNPERHFASFGGLFPNPAVTCAALASITSHVELRAGSCVVPLHSPIRVAEDWAVVDNLSNGRVGIAVASGWAPPDFAIKPENYADAKNIMFESLDQVRRLWRGEKVSFPGPEGEVEVRTLPRPIQKELPYWVTTAGNVDTFRRAGEAGANILTHLLGQTFAEVKEKVEAYRSAWKSAGHAGQGTITLMLHTLIGENMAQVESLVRGPMKAYLKSAMFLVKGAAWNFPTFKKMSDETGKSLDEFFETISDEDMDELLEFAFQRYFHSSGLFGTPDSALETVSQCLATGVDEIACLIDFGIDTRDVLQHLPYLNELKQKSAGLARPAVQGNMSASVRPGGRYTLQSLIEQHQVTHFQCTPSMATMLVSDPESRASLPKIQHMMVGGEALTPALAKSLVSSIGGRLTNMYGPTETTIWSSTCDIDAEQEISIGRPIANTRLYIVDQHLNVLPAGIPGELVIAGDGVVRGYHQRPELTQERFVDDWRLTPDSAAQRIYRTGDLARYQPDGQLVCLGRIDHQVKIRGYRIELGEIEARILEYAGVRECAVILREDKTGDKRLVAYLCPDFEQHIDQAELKSHLLACLPDFMVPANFVELTSMPLTPNGKLDRNALPEPIQQKHQSSDDFELPKSNSETLVAEIWKKALGITEVGRKDNFFDIGGHSLLVIQVLKELREHKDIARPVQMTDLFRYTTVEALANFISAEDTEEKSKEAVSSRVAARKAAMNRRRRR